MKSLLKKGAFSEVKNYCNGTRTHNHLVLKGAINRLLKLTKSLTLIVTTYLYGANGCIVSSYLYKENCLYISIPSCTRFRMNICRVTYAF